MESRVQVNGNELPVSLEFGQERGRWSMPEQLPESYFPLTAHAEGRRFELYSDGTFSEVEL